MLSVLLSLFIQAQALTTTDTLPRGVSSPQLKYGFITGLEQRYNSSNKLVNLRDKLTVNLDSKTLMKMTADAKNLVSAFNHVGQYKLGEQINLGTLKVETEPSINYVAPVFAHGINDSWSLAAGFPIITYDNKVRVTQQGSNLEYYRTQFSNLHPDLDKALNTNLVHEAHATLEQQGYKPVKDRNEKFLGDVQLSSLYQIQKTSNSVLLYQATLTLPTGPKYDADDLMALNSFGRTSIENKLAYSRKLKAWSLIPYTSLTKSIPDKVTMRVPENEDDILPNANSKENVNREIGTTLSLGHDTIFDINDDFSIGAGYEFNFKQKDQYSGTQGRRYDLLESDTDTQSQRVSAQLAYNTINAFLKKKSKIPTQVSFNYSDIVSGKNIARQTVQEVQFLLLF